MEKNRNRPRRASTASLQSLGGLLKGSLAPRVASEGVADDVEQSVRTPWRLFTMKLVILRFIFHSGMPVCVVLALFDNIDDDDDDELSYLALALICTYALAELLLLTAATKFGWVDDGGPWSLVGRLILVHLAAWYGQSRLGWTTEFVLLYTGHALVALIAQLSQRLRHRAELLAHERLAEAKEIRVQYSALRDIVKRGFGHDDNLDELSDDSLDDRIHEIKPPKPVTLSFEAMGRPAKALKEGLCGGIFDRELALKITASIRATLDTFHNW